MITAIKDKKSKISLKHSKIKFFTLTAPSFRLIEKMRLQSKPQKTKETKPLSLSYFAQ
jgi:hypothetical protein